MELVLVAAAIAYAIYRAETTFRFYMKLRYGEKKPEEPMPTVLYVSAMSESEEWARTDALARYYELYEQMGRDWTKVASMVIKTNG